jgi:hypothetical protein
MKILANHSQWPQKQRPSWQLILVATKRCERPCVCVCTFLLILFAGRNNIVTSQSARHVLEQDEKRVFIAREISIPRSTSAANEKNGCRRRLKAHGRHVKFPVLMTELSSLIWLHPSARPTVNVRTPASGAIFQTRASSAGRLKSPSSMQHHVAFKVKCIETERRLHFIFPRRGFPLFFVSAWSKLRRQSPSHWT